MIPLATPDWAAPVLSAFALILSAYFGLRGMRASAGAQEKTAQAQAAVAQAAAVAAGEDNAGKMALQLAKDLRGELNVVKQELDDERLWRRLVYAWWRNHDDRDDALLEELEQARPGASERVPPRVALPDFPPEREPYRKEDK